MFLFRRLCFLCFMFYCYGQKAADKKSTLEIGTYPFSLTLLRVKTCHIVNYTDTILKTVCEQKSQIKSIKIGILFIRILRTLLRSLALGTRRDSLNQSRIMAARKSCTHMTWAEAKSKSGVAPTSKNKDAGRIKAENHGKLLAAKILAKAGPSQEEQIQNRQAARQAKRDEQRQAQLVAQREAEKERQRQEAIARPHERALERLSELATAFEQSNHPGLKDEEELDPNIVCESKQLQVDELLALQAIYADTPDMLVVAIDSQWQDLQIKVEAWQDDPSPESEEAVMRHPPIRLALKKSIENPEDEDWIAYLLVELILPPTYPMQATPPSIKVSWFCRTQKSLVVAFNKPLETMGVLDEKRLVEALTEQAQELIGMPCLYEILDNWFAEHCFEFISVSSVVVPA